MGGGAREIAHARDLRMRIESQQARVHVHIFGDKLLRYVHNAIQKLKKV